MKLIPCPSRTQSPGSRLELSACKLERAFSCQLISKAASFAAIVRPLTPLHHPFHQSLLPRSPPHLTNNKLVIIINGRERAMSKVQLKRDSPAPSKTQEPPIEPLPFRPGELAEPWPLEPDHTQKPVSSRTDIRSRESSEHEKQSPKRHRLASPGWRMTDGRKTHWSFCLFGTNWIKCNLFINTSGKCVYKNLEK